MTTTSPIFREPLYVEGYTVYYDNRCSAEQTIEEVFGQQQYAFKADQPAPFIVDGGSNIGIATLFFKKCYPAAKIFCFEPDPVSFSVLEKNIAINHLSDVRIFNAALSNQKRKIKFYGQVGVVDPDARGNSLLPEWGLQRRTSQTIEVDAVKLSDYIAMPVDLLKLDIEGAEQLVLEELGEKLGFVKAITLEFHQAKAIQSRNDLEATLALLKQYHFDVTVLDKSLTCFPEATAEWAESVKPTLYHLKAFKQGL